jgi:hypothetical protein
VTVRKLLPMLPNLLEAGFAVVFLGGVAMVSVPAALMIAGVLGVLAVERGSK